MPPEQVAEAIRTWNTANPDRMIDFVSVGDPPDLPKGTNDPTILLWAEKHDCLLLTVDYRSMPVHLANHLTAGHRSPGVLSVRPGTAIPKIVEDLVMITVAGDTADFRDVLTYIPL